MKLSSEAFYALFFINLATIALFIYDFVVLASHGNWPGAALVFVGTVFIGLLALVNLTNARNSPWD